MIQRLNNYILPIQVGLYGIYFGMDMLKEICISSYLNSMLKINNGVKIPVLQIMLFSSPISLSLSPHAHACTHAKRETQNQDNLIVKQSGLKSRSLILSLG